MSVLLLATDFSPRSDRALRRAVLLARAGGHELRIVAVLEDGAAAEPALERDRALALLGEMETSIVERDRIPCSVELRAGNPPEQLALAAEEAGACLIVIGPHRRTLMRDAFGSITAERIVQRSPVPVLAANGVPSGDYGRALVPVCLDDVSRHTVAAVRDLDLLGTAEVTLLHVFDPEAREMMSRAMMLADERQQYLDDCAAGARAELKAFAQASAMPDARLLVEETSGLVAADIDRVASRFAADLIVLSASDKSVVAKTLLGSVTADLLRPGKFDVLVVPRPASGD